MSGAMVTDPTTVNPPMDWPQMDSSSVLPPTSVEMAAGDMLFGGAADILFGEDELMDMYTSATEAAGQTGEVGEAAAMAHLLATPPPPIVPAVTQGTQEGTTMSDGGHGVSPVFSSADDGLGALRPNTSFNDFTKLPEPPAPTADVASAAAPPSVVSNTNVAVAAAPEEVASSTQVVGNLPPPPLPVVALPQQQACAPPPVGDNQANNGVGGVPTESSNEGKRKSPSQQPEMTTIDISGYVVPSPATGQQQQPPTVSAPKVVVAPPAQPDVGTVTPESVVSAAPPVSQVAPPTMQQSIPAPPLAAPAPAPPAAATTSNKRRKTSVSSNGGQTKKPTSTRRAAAAEAVAQFTPLAQTQVAKIRQSASLLANANLGGVGSSSPSLPSSSPSSSSNTAALKLKQKLAHFANTPNPLMLGGAVAKGTTSASQNPIGAPPAAANPLTNIGQQQQQQPRAVPPVVAPTRPMSPNEQDTIKPASHVTPVTPNPSDCAPSNKVAEAPAASLPRNNVPRLVSIGVVTASSDTVAAPAPSVVPSAVIPQAPTSSDLVAKAAAAAAAAVKKPEAATASQPQPQQGQGPSGSMTSTAHVTALTSSTHWVSQQQQTQQEQQQSQSQPKQQQQQQQPAPAAAPAIAAQTSASAAAAAAAAVAASKRARRQNLTPDERAKQNRDRNREHARNTRLRKKAYVEELKKTLTEVVAERDAAELERQFEARRERECRAIRLNVMEEFLNLRCAGRYGDDKRWTAILDESFVLRLPVTNYRKMVGRDDENGLRSRKAAGSQDENEQNVRGKDDVMADAVSLCDFVDSFGKTNPSDQSHNMCGTRVRLMYEADRSRFLMDGCTAVLDWSARTSGAVSQGALSELSVKGTMRATFVSTTNKLLTVDMSFDTGTIVSQLSGMSSLLAHSVPKELVGSLHQTACCVGPDVDATALLDSLDVPHLDDALFRHLPDDPAPAVSVTSSEKSVCSSDEADPLPQEGHQGMLKTSNGQALKQT